jgi:hypothetical protein
MRPSLATTAPTGPYRRKGAHSRGRISDKGIIAAELFRPGRNHSIGPVVTIVQSRDGFPKTMITEPHVPGWDTVDTSLQARRKAPAADAR